MDQMKKVFIILSVFFQFPLCLIAQDHMPIELDPVVVEAVKKGFSVNDFVELVKTDTSFYEAFKMLKKAPYEVQAKVIVYNKEDKGKAELIRTAHHYTANGKRWMQVITEKTNGKFYTRNKKHRYYTSELLDYIFFPKDTQEIAAVLGKSGDESKNEKYQDKLKTLIFQPGAEVGGVPIVGKRMAVFDKEMTPYYNYKIASATYKDTINCYVFSCEAKKDLGFFDKDKPVIKELVSYFDKKTFNVVSRKYVLIYSSPVFDFDVTMDVQLMYRNNVLVPEIITYKGKWDVPLHSEENIFFRLNFSNYQQ